MGIPNSFTVSDTKRIGILYIFLQYLESPSFIKQSVNLRTFN